MKQLDLLIFLLPITYTILGLGRVSSKIRNCTSYWSNHLNNILVQKQNINSWKIDGFIKYIDITY